MKAYTDAGHTLGTYDLLTNTGRIPEANLIQQEMGDIGIKLKVDAVPNAEFTTRLNAGSFDIAYNGVTAFNGVPWNFLRNIDSKQRHAQHGPANPALDAAIQQASYGITAADRATAAKTIQKINATEFDYIWFGPAPAGFAGKKDVELGPRYPGISTLVAQDIWLNR